MSHGDFGYFFLVFGGRLRLPFQNFGYIILIRAAEPFIIHYERQCAMKITVIFTGGTIACSESNNILSPDGKNRALLLSLYESRYGKNADFICETPYFSLSENNTGENLGVLADCVCKAVNTDCDGVIVAHGTDTLQYSSALLSYALGARSKPVLLVSSRRVLTDEKANGVENFAAAVEFIKGRFGKGVFVSYQNEDGVVYIHRGSRLLPHSELSADIFSIKNQYYGKFENGRFIKNPDYRAKPDEVPPFGKVNLKKYGNSVAVIQPYVGFEYPENVTADCVLIKAYHSGTLCTDDTSFRRFAENLTNGKIPCFVCGCEGESIYESEKIYSEYKITPLPPAALISQYIKAWLCAQTKKDFAEMSRLSLGEDLL